MKNRAHNILIRSFLHLKRAQQKGVLGMLCVIFLVCICQHGSLQQVLRNVADTLRLFASQTCTAKGGFRDAMCYFFRGMFWLTE